MPKTPYCPKNQVFSDKAHLAARKQIYANLFFGADLTFRSCNVANGGIDEIYDGKMAVDRIVSVTVEELEASLNFTVQERFRHPRYANFKDITITSWNHKTNQPSELYKMDCSLFVYGYYDQDKDSFLDWVVFSPQAFKLAMIDGRLIFHKEVNPRSDQSFISIKFDALRQSNLLILNKQSLNDL